ncbi:MAG: cysteine--tRNA ligase, partial [Candidatus Paceibacterota bacterium]
GVYFDTAKMPDYGVLWGGKRIADREHARIDENSEKHNPEDFALWKFNDKIGYPSKWGQGFPGWHIECSAMGMKFLGEQFDIHTGGIDHISIHHTNEIAQSECATGKKPFVNFWLHNEFVDTGGEKMAKSGDNFLTLSKVTERKINPLAYRFLLLMVNYRSKLNFNWEALEAADVALKRLYRQYLALGSDVGKIVPNYHNKFIERISDDLDTPRIVSLIWDLVSDWRVSDADKKATLIEFDKVLSLGFTDLKEEVVPEEILILVEERKKARMNLDFQKSDELRDKIYSLGYEVKDTKEGPKVLKLD